MDRMAEEESSAAGRMMSTLRPLALAALLCAPLGCGGERASTPGAATAKPQAVHAAQDVSSKDLTGRSVRLSDYLGKRVVLMNFWATFCEPCKAEFPHLQRLYAEKKDAGFSIVGVAVDGPDTVSDVPAFVQRNGLSFPIWLDEDSSVRAIYNPKSDAPVSVLIDRKGNVRHIRVGYNPGDEVALEAEVRALLSEP